MRRQRRRDTKPELELRRRLHARGLRYRVDHNVFPETRRRQDIVFTRARVIVDVRGCYWHACPVHGTQPRENSGWWAEKLRSNVERDDDTERRAIATGWSYLIVWEHESPDKAAERVEHVVRGALAEKCTPRI
jgi:DNA mismatch endonuclease (patch repair protein)